MQLAMSVVWTQPAVRLRLGEHEVYIPMVSRHVAACANQAQQALGDLRLAFAADVIGAAP